MTKQIIFYTLLLSVFSSCSDMVQEIDWQTKEVPKKLVVEAEITTDLEYQTVELKLSDDYFVNQPPKLVSGAQVSVVSSVGTYRYKESENVPGIYFSENEYAGMIGEDYELKVELGESIDGVLLYSAHTHIYPSVRIDTMFADAYKNPWAFSDDDSSLVILITIQGLEPPSMDNYYLVKYFRNDTVLNDTVSRYQTIADFDYEIDGAEEFYLYTDLEYFEGDTLGIEVYSIDKDYYDFIYACWQISMPQDPLGFMGPPADAYGNINNGDAFGYFFGSEVARGKAVVKKVVDSGF